MPIARALFPAVLPRPPALYDQAYFARLIDILQKHIEQTVQPREIGLLPSGH